MSISDVTAGFAELIKDNPTVASEILGDIDPITWMSARANLRTEKLEPLEFKDHLPMVDVYRDWHPLIVAQKGSQIGMTTCQICKLLYYCDTHNITAIYTMPTAKDVFEFSQARFAPVIKASNYLSARMGNVDNATLKRMGASTLYFRGAQKHSQAISVPADIIVNDEYDFSAQDVMDTFEKRVGASKLKWFWRFSTPSIPDFGINALYKDTDQRHWLVRCTSCGKWQDVTFEHNLLKRKGETPYFGCRRCSVKLNRRNGAWVAKHPQKATDAVYDDQGRLVAPADGMRGYWINPLTFTYVTATNVWSEWRKVERKNTNFARKRFHNFDLGLPYLTGEGLITRDTILRTMAASVPDTGFNVIGVDQGDLLHWVVRRVLPTGRMAVVAFGVTNDFFKIDHVISLYRIRSGIIDALPNKHNARDLVQRFRGRMYMAYYKDQREEKKYITENKRREQEKRKKEQETETSTMHLDRTETLDDSAQDWIDGMAFLVGDPMKNLNEEQEEFIRQMTNMKRDLQEDAKGNTVAVWLKVGDDHYRHADNYAKAAANIYGRGRIEDLHVGGALEGPGGGGLRLQDLVPAGMDLRSTFASLKGF
jgi:Phage terminase large subunit gpA, ATPase domain